MTMLVNYEVEYSLSDTSRWFETDYRDMNMNAFDIPKAMRYIFDCADAIDMQIQALEPYKKIKIDKEGAEVDLRRFAQGLYDVACMLSPMLPSTSKSIIMLLKEKKKPVEPLFLRK